MAERPQRLRSSSRLEAAPEPQRPKRVRKPPQTFEPAANGDSWLGRAAAAAAAALPVQQQRRQQQRPSKRRKTTSGATTTSSAARPLSGNKSSTQVRVDAVAEFLRANPGRHTRRDVVRKLWPGIDFLSGNQWRLIEGDPRISCTLGMADGSTREIHFYRAAGSKRRQMTMPAAGHGAVDAWMDNADVVRRLRAFAKGRQTFESFSVLPGGPGLGAPNAGSVFFHRLSPGRNCVNDDYEWRYQNGTTSDSALRTSATLLNGKCVVKGRHSVLPADRHFQRRTFYLAEEEEPSVRMVQYIHARGRLQPPSGGLKRPGDSGRPNRPKKQHVRTSSAALLKNQHVRASPAAQLKDTDITFRHKLTDLDELASQRKQLRYKAIIVGAGAAGLGAARQLIDAHGMHPDDILVLEAGSRIGGRIHTKLFEAKHGLPAVRVDLGASYLHGYDFESFFDNNEMAEKNPLQALVEEHKLKIKVDENIRQAYSNGWLKHSAWYVNGDGKPKMAKTNYEYKGGEWDGPEEVFLIDLEIDARLEEIVEKLSQSERDDADPDSLYAHADVDVRSQFDAVRKQVLDAKKFAPEKKQKIHDILESLAVVKWGYCGPLEQISLCDAFGVTSTFGFDYEQEPEKSAYDSEAATSTDASSSSSEEQPPEAVAEPNLESAAAQSPEPWVRQGMYDAMMLDGYGEVIDILSASVPVAMNAKVESIRLDNQGRRSKILVSVQTPMQTLLLQADGVIVTVSLGVLKSGQVAFDPPMEKWPTLDSEVSVVDESRGAPAAAVDVTASKPRPMPKSAVIEALGFGFENKVVVRFAEKFWTSRKGGNTSHWQLCDQRFRFLNLDALGKPGTVVAHVGPPFSVEYKDRNGKQYSDRQVVLEVCKALQQMFALEKMPVPVDSHVTHWGQDELVRGSYSYQKVYSGSDMCDSLGVPEWGGRLCFAGEACCQTRVQCVDGALVTGRNAADNIATLLAK